MNVILSWIINNKEWVFSGVGVAIIGIFIGRKELAKRQASIKTNIVIKDNEESPISFNGANFGVITNEVQNDKHKKAD